MKKPAPPPRWLASGKAAEALGISKTSLRRLASEGVLQEGTHFVKGRTAVSPWRWDVTSVANTLTRLTALPPRPCAGECRADG
jgi:hypothetical protein